jgi:hypothetical protein
MARMSKLQKAHEITAQTHAAAKTDLGSYPAIAIENVRALALRQIYERHAGRGPRGSHQLGKTPIWSFPARTLRLRHSADGRSTPQVGTTPIHPELREALLQLRAEPPVTIGTFIQSERGGLIFNSICFYTFLSSVHLGTGELPNAVITILIVNVHNCHEFCDHGRPI